ncbi:hypothetical protein FA15DRAFT_634302 [Coprinopsis marcescibilis]|uniref:Uncharacterized protein n=1 Tax=Coprinopsis marcescibilis TaxID=230819 RepID=A0A5C3L503_COPMA|nr:hypothetical protein FA15DRAFT_634302 [Coprinopsis marcescibilis]
MFLCRARHRLSVIRCYRAYSTETDPYSSFQKLRAYPFAFDENDAKRLLAPAAAALCKENIISSTLHRLLPWLEFKYLEPKRIVPVYFPAWIVDAEVESKVKYNGSEKVAVAQIQNGYLPGSDFQVVSSIPLFPNDLHQTTPLPWSEGLLNQKGQQITCLPFNIDPLQGLKAFSDAKFNSYPNLQCSMEGVQPRLAVFRPILLPLYLAQYETTGTEPGEKRACTLFMDATDPMGTMYGVRVPTGYSDDWDESLDNVAKVMKAYVAPNSDVLLFGSPNDWVSVETVSLVPHREISTSLTDWISHTMYESSTASKLSAASSVTADWDPRIREYDVEDRAEVEEWMGVGAELMLVRRILERINEQMGLIGDDAPVHMRASIDHLESKEKELKEKREELIPVWWKLHKPDLDQ